MIVAASQFQADVREFVPEPVFAATVVGQGEFPMIRWTASSSMKTLIVIFALAATPAISFAQTTGGATGSTGGVAHAPAPARGTNSAGTAQSSGANTAAGTTTGAALGTNPDADAAVSAENRLLDKKMKGICRGC
ncbi:hypothetical protein [Bradyrhizobium manausense]|uniref:hypothetical protein n=1 Tax=Bradyrhizobium manausense TaxID=989370 RepID=UPI003D9B86AE